MSGNWTFKCLLSGQCLAAGALFRAWLLQLCAGLWCSCLGCFLVGLQKTAETWLKEILWQIMFLSPFLLGLNILFKFIFFFQQTTGARGPIPAGSVAPSVPFSASLLGTLPVTAGFVPSASLSEIFSQPLASSLENFCSPLSTFSISDPKRGKKWVLICNL